MLKVFRNQTAYSRFWSGRLHFNTITTSLRCLTRQILVLAPPPPPPRHHPYLAKLGDEIPLLRCAYTRSAPNIAEIKNVERKTEDEEAAEKVIETVKVLIAMLYTIKNHLRADWGVALSPGMCITEDGQVTGDMEYKDLLPKGLRGYEHQGLALTLELSVFVESVTAGAGSTTEQHLKCWLNWINSSMLMGIWKLYDLHRYLLLICTCLRPTIHDIDNMNAKSISTAGFIISKP
jgi:ion channel-forming bestrophin family protein